jgi:hypothetical protein
MLRLRQDAEEVRFTVRLPGDAEGSRFRVDARGDRAACIVELAGDASPAAALGLERGLLSLAALRPAKVRIDTSRVRTLPVLVLGVLAGFGRTQRQRGSEVEWLDPSGIARAAWRRSASADAERATPDRERPDEARGVSA